MRGVELQKLRKAAAKKRRRQAYLKLYDARRDKTKKRELGKKYYKNNTKKVLSRTKFYMYGITPEQYEKLWLNQKGKCAICNQPETRKDSRSGVVVALSIDHCHTTNKIRGLLCSKHNSMIALSNDNSAILREGARYLDESL